MRTNSNLKSATDEVIQAIPVTDRRELRIIGNWA